MQIQNNRQSFNGSYRMYFYTHDGKRIVSDENMKKCLHYVEAHLNNSKRLKQRNVELVDNFKFGQIDKQTGKRVGGDKDFLNFEKMRAVFRRIKDRKDGFINIVTGKDAEYIDKKFGKEIGKAKHMGLERTGTTKTFESSYAVNQYYNNAVDYAEHLREGDKAFGVAFTPIYKKNGEIKGFEYHHSGYFNESKIKPDTPVI
ncbi:hypothetical protein IKJ53_00850 [bacterium]|nr:hypothetical protein [bacterium]